jgi:hypothetical protein
VAVHPIRVHRWTIDPNFEKEPRSGSLLALAGGIGEIPDPLFVAGRHWEPIRMVTRFRKRAVLCDGGS